jgi:hypothetical protein
MQGQAVLACPLHVPVKRRVTTSANSVGARTKSRLQHFTACAAGQASLARSAALHALHTTNKDDKVYCSYRCCICTLLSYEKPVLETSDGLGVTAAQGRIVVMDPRPMAVQTEVFVHA